MNFSNMNGEQLRQYKSDHGPGLERDVNEWLAATAKLGLSLKSLEAHERASFTVTDFVSQVEDAALAFLPEELRDFLSTTTGPLLALAGQSESSPETPVLLHKELGS